MMRLLILFLSISIGFMAACGQDHLHKFIERNKNAAYVDSSFNPNAKTVPGAERMDQYLSRLEGQRVAVFANHTSLVQNTNLVDTLVKRGVKITVIFGPEHGFRGTANAGEKIGNYVDEKTGIPVISLYGSKTKPSAEDLENVDVLLFDIQDVGTRFYTYISSMQEYMEAAVENNKHLIILDRPNPNGFYVDGPVLDTSFRSFVGMQPVPIVYGMTMGEYARMILKEGWLKKNPATDLFNTELKFDERIPKISTLRPFQLTVIRCENYSHKSKYSLPVKPSPNLPDMSSIYWYPSTCWFEGTVLSEGRGTGKPFQLFGHPSLPANLVAFTPRSMPGATNPKWKDQLCYGWDLSGSPAEVLKKVDNKIQLKYLQEAFRLFPNKDSFFRANNSFNRLAGNNVLMQQIKQGMSEDDIRKSWEPALSNFKAIRKKYLLYQDF
jgi:uncharacterized protein YbbC (DUF1343 family)